MKALATALCALVLLFASSLANCARPDKTRATSSMEKCIAEFKAIPEIDAILGLRDTGQSPDPDPQPFKGMEIAVTLNGAIMPTADPEADADDVCYKQNNTDNFRRLLTALNESGMPATVDFVNGRFFDPGLAEQWVAAGNLLGNLTYDNRRAGQLGVDEFVSDIAKADERLAQLLQKQARPVKYFRYPAHRVPRDRSSRELIDQYLGSAGYTTVPYTIESKDDKLADIYCKALDEADKSCASLVKVNYYSVLMDTTLRARAAARELTGRDASQILVLYCNQFTCDTLAETLAWYRRLGARFISLDQALRDPLYKSTTGDGEPMGITVANMVKNEQRGQRE